MKRLFKCLLLALLFATTVPYTSCDISKDEEVISDDFSIPGTWLLEGPTGIYVYDTNYRYEIRKLYARFYRNGDADFLAFYNDQLVGTFEGGWTSWLYTSRGSITLHLPEGKMEYDFNAAREYSAVLEGRGGDIIMRRITDETYDQAARGNLTPWE